MARSASKEANPNARRRRENVDPIFIFLNFRLIGRYDTHRVSHIVNASPKGEGSKDRSPHFDVAGNAQISERAPWRFPQSRVVCQVQQTWSWPGEAVPSEPHVARDGSGEV